MQLILNAHKHNVRSGLSHQEQKRKSRSRNKEN